MNISLGEDDFDMAQFEGMTPVDMMFAMRKALEFKMPPVGATTHTAWFGGYKWTRTTWRCTVKGCWYVCTPRVGDDESLDVLVNLHQTVRGEERCPTPPRRESLPSGLAEIEKLWREMDDVVDAMKSKTEHRGKTGESLAGYAIGIAFSIVMKDKDLWPDTKSVARQALNRWKMRNRQIDYEPTPTRHQNDAKLIGQSGGWKKVAGQDGTQAQPPAKKAAPRKAAAPVQLSADKVKAIKAGFASGMFTEEELGSMYGATAAQVKQLVG